MSAADLIPRRPAPAVMSLSRYRGFKTRPTIDAGRANEVTHLRNGPLGREESFGRGPLDRVPVVAVSRRPTVNPSFDQVAVDAGVDGAGRRRRVFSENTNMNANSISTAFGGIVQQLRHVSAGGVPGVPPLSHPRVGHGFSSLKLGDGEFFGVSQVSHPQTELLRTRSRTHTRTHTLGYVYDKFPEGWDRWDTPEIPDSYTLSRRNRRPTRGWDRVGHPGTRVSHPLRRWSA